MVALLGDVYHDIDTEYKLNHGRKICALLDHYQHHQDEIDLAHLGNFIASDEKAIEAFEEVSVGVEKILKKI